MKEAEKVDKWGVGEGEETGRMRKTDCTNELTNVGVGKQDRERLNLVRSLEKLQFLQVLMSRPLIVPQSFDCVSKAPGDGKITTMDDFPKLFKKLP